MTTVGGNNEFSGIDAFKAVSDSLYYQTPGQDSEGRLYIQLKTKNGVTTAYSTDNRSNAASFAELTNFIEKNLYQGNLNKAEKKVILTALSYEKDNVTLGLWDKVFNTSKKMALDKANKIEKDNTNLFNSQDFSVDDDLGDSVFPPDER